MAKKVDIGARLALEGEKEFRRALSEVNAGLQVNRSAMALVTAEYQGNATSMDALRAKSKALEESIYSQRDKVKLLRAAVNKSSTEYGNSSKKTMEWQIKLNNAQRELVNMEGELDNYKEAMGRAEQGTASMGDVVRGLTDTLGLDIPPALQGVVSKLDDVSASGAALVGVVGGIVVALGKMTIETAKTADDLLTLSSTTGIATVDLQKFKYASELLDVSSETMQGSLTKMIRTMSEAKKGTGDAAEAYRRLHLRITGSRGELRDANMVFYEAIDALGKVKNETERDALAMQIFGKSARELNPLIEAGSAKLKELGIEAEAVGYVMDDHTLQSFGQLDDAMQRMSKQGDALKNQLALALLPVLTSLFQAISSVPVPVLQTIIVLTTTIGTVLLVVKSIKEMTETAGAIKGFFGGMSAQTIKTTAIIMGVVAALIALGVIIAVIVGRGKDLQATMGQIGTSVGQISGQVTSTQQSYNNLPAYAKGIQYHAGGPAIINDGPGYPGEIVDLPRGARVYPAGVQPQDGGDIYVINISQAQIKSWKNVEDMAKQARQDIRRR